LVDSISLAGALLDVSVCIVREN